jgi:hypothetical protein
MKTRLLHIVFSLTVLAASGGEWFASPLTWSDGVY